MFSRERKLATNTLWLMLGKICTQCIGFFMLPLYTSILTTNEYGTVDVIMTYVSLLLPIFTIQFEQGLFRMLLDVRGDENKERKLFSSVIIANLFQIMLFIILFTLISNYLNYNYLDYLLALLPLHIVQGTFLQFSRGIDKTVDYSIASLLNAFIHITLNVVFIAFLDLRIEGLFYSIIIATVSSILYLCFSLKIWKYFSVKYVDVNVLKSISKYTIPLIPNELSWWTINASDRVIISSYIGNEMNGVYSVANKFSSIFITFYNFFNMAWTESVSLSLGDKDADLYIEKMINIFFNILVSLCLIIIALMPFIFSILINSKFEEAYLIIPILMVAVFFQALQGLYSALYVALKKTSDIAKTSMVAAIINIVLNVLFIDKFGLYAASFSTLVAFASMAIYRYIDVKKYICFEISAKSIFKACVMLVVVCVGYYSSNKIIEMLVLISVGLYAFLSNRNFVFSIICFFRKK